MPKPRTIQGKREARRDVMQLKDLQAAIRDRNPFDSNRVTEPSRYEIDVEAIHNKEFHKIVDLSARALERRAAIGVALLGGAGVGKSHLLSRIYRWSEGPGDGGPVRANYVYLLNILADPERLPRYLLKCVVSRLAEGGLNALHETPLFQLVDQAVRALLKTQNYSIAQGWEAFRAEFSRNSDLPEVALALYQFLRHSRPAKASDPTRKLLASAAVAWLSGDEIDPEHARTLELRVSGPDPVMLKDDQQVEQVMYTLTRLARLGGQPFILCIDQVDNLDDEKLAGLSRFLHAVLDRGENLLVITSGVRVRLDERVRNETISASTWDRLSEYKIELGRIKAEDSRRILEARLERFLDPFVELEAVRKHLREDTLFPLGSEWLRDRLSDGFAFRPRDVITWARDAWEDRQSDLARLGIDRWLETWPAGVEPITLPPPPPPTPGEVDAAIDAVVDRKIEEQIAHHRLHEGSLPPDAGNLAGTVEMLLSYCLGSHADYTLKSVQRLRRQGGRLPAYDLFVEEQRPGDGALVTNGVVFITNIGLSASASLRRLLEDESPPTLRILVTDDERRPLKVGQQGLEYYRDLVRLGPGRFEHLRIDFEQYARLDALANVVTMARVGDLEVEIPRGTIRAVSEAEVVASHHRRDRFRSHPLLRRLLTEEPPIIDVPKPDPRLDEPDVRQFVMAQLAWMMGSTAAALSKGYVEVMKAPKVEQPAAWPQVKAIVSKMHTEGLVHATPQDDDLFVLVRR